MYVLSRAEVEMRKSSYDFDCLCYTQEAYIVAKRKAMRVDEPTRNWLISALNMPILGERTAPRKEKRSRKLLTAR